MAHRGVWTFLDISVSSGSNFLLSVIVVRSLDSRGFGAFAVALSVYFLCLEATRAVAAEPALSRPVYSDAKVWGRTMSSLTGFALMLGLFGAAAISLGSILAPPDVQRALVVLGGLLPFLLLQDVCRYIFFSDGQPRKALLNDSVWLLGLSIGLFFLVRSGSTVLLAFLAVWGISGGIAGGVGLVQARCLPNLGGALTWFKGHRDLGLPLLLEFLVNRGSTQLVLLGLGSIAGLPALGLFAASRLIMGPFTILQLGSTAFGLPEAVRIVKSKISRLTLFTQLLSFSLVAFVAIYTAAVHVLSSDVGTFLFGDTWIEARALLPLTALWIGLDAVSQGPRIALRALENAREILRARALTSPMVLTGGLTGAMLGDARGTCIGLAIGLALSASVWWTRFVASVSSRIHSDGANLGAAPAEEFGEHI